MKKAKPSKKGASGAGKEAPAERADGRRATSIYLKLEILTGLQNAATYKRVHAYEIVEEALKEYFVRNKLG